MKSDALCSVVEAWHSPVNFTYAGGRGFFALFGFVLLDCEGPVNPLFHPDSFSKFSRRNWAGSLFCSWKSSWKPLGWSLVLIEPTELWSELSVSLISPGAEDWVSSCNLISKPIWWLRHHQHLHWCINKNIVIGVVVIMDSITFDYINVGVFGQHLFFFNRTFSFPALYRLYVRLKSVDYKLVSV